MRDRLFRQGIQVWNDSMKPIKKTNSIIITRERSKEEIELTEYLEEQRERFLAKRFN